MLGKKTILTVGIACMLSSGSTYASALNNDIYINSISIDSDIHLKDEDKKLQKLLNKYPNKHLTMANIKEIKNNVSKMYEKAGYTTSVVYIPVQDIYNNTLTLKVISGKLGTLSINNYSKMNDRVFNHITENFKENEVINDYKIRSTVYNINSIPGVKAKALFTPSTNNGCTNINIKIQDDKDYNGVIYTDNYGNNYSGRYRFGILSNFYNVDKFGTNISIGGMLSNKDLNSFSLDVNTLFSPYKTNSYIGLSIERTQYQVNGKYSELGINGSYTNYGIYGKTIVRNDTNKKLNYLYGYNYKDIQDNIDKFDITSNKYSNTVYFGINGNNRIRSSYVDYSLNTSIGKHNECDNAYTDGVFKKINGNINYYTNISPQLLYKSKSKIQLANKSLDSSEKIFVGGVNGVRAYSSGDFAGDCGFVSQNAVSYPIKSSNMAVDLFFDMARSKNRLDDIWHSLYGCGVELSYTNKDKYFAKLDYARRISCVPNETKPHNRIWFVAGETF